MDDRGRLWPGGRSQPSYPLEMLVDAMSADQLRKVLDPSAERFEEFYRRTRKPMIRWAAPLASYNAATAEDLVQDAFARAWKNWDLLGSLAEGQRIRWIQTTIVRLVAEAGRRQIRWEELARLCYEPGDVSKAPDPQDAALAAIPAAQCLQLIARMSPIERQVSMLCWVLGYSGAQAARILGVKEATIRGVKKRARDRLLTEVGTDSIIYWASNARRTVEGGTA